MWRRKLACTALLAAACGSAGDTVDRVELSAGEASFDVYPGLAFYAPGLNVVVRPSLGVVNALDPDASYDPHWLEHRDALTPDPPADLRWRSMTRSSLVERADDRAVVDLDFDGLHAQLVVRADAPGRFSAKLLPDASRTVAWMRVELVATDDAYYGLGEWPDDVNHKGKLRPMQIEPDLRLEGANNENHAPIPLLIGTSGWGVFVESRRFGLFDLRESVTITYGTAEESASGLAFHLFAADHPLDLTKHYYDLTGAPKLPAPWALGPLIWRDESEDQAEVEADIDAIRDLDLPASGIWIDRPYATAVNTFDFDPAKFPDPARMIAKAHGAGLRMALWHAPYAAEDAGEVRTRARSEGWFPRKSGILLNRWSEPIDFTNPAAYAGWQSLIRRYADMGIEGFKLDYGEDVVAGLGGARTPWQFHDGSSELTQHYEYTRLYHRIYAETLPAEGGFLLCRTARWGDQVNAPIIWPGDLDADFSRHGERVEDYNAAGGLPAALAMGLSLGPSGFPFYGSDTGGYRHSPPDEETFIRWFQQTALSVVMQVGDSSSQPPWVFTPENGRDSDTLDLYRRYARLHLRLFPYLWTYATRLPADGRAIQRALGLAHPELGVHPSDTYLLGDHLLVAPVVVKGARERTVEFPFGRWVHWFRGTIHQGRGVTVPAPLEELPLFLREGGIVPLLRPTIDTLSPVAVSERGRTDSFSTDPGVLHVRVAPGPASRFDLYDGTSVSQDGSSVHVVPGGIFRSGAILEIAGLAMQPATVTLDAAPHTATSSAGLTLVQVPAGEHTVSWR